MFKFSERFGSVRQQSRYLTKFETRNRGQGETIASLGDDLRLLAQRAYPELGTAAQKSLALYQFYKAISLEMKCRCIDRDCMTVESAVQVVEQYEAILGEGTEKKKGNVRAINNIADSRPSNPQPYHNRSNNGAKSKDKAQPSATTEAILKQVLDRLEKLEVSLLQLPPKKVTSLSLIIAVVPALVASLLSISLKTAPFIRNAKLRCKLQMDRCWETRIRQLYRPGDDGCYMAYHRC